MIKIYLTEDGCTNLINEPCKGCWINVVNPTEKEINYLLQQYDIDEDDFRAALDEEESSRIDVEDNYTIIVADVPAYEERNGKNRYVTLPLGIIVLKEAIMTICLQKTSVLDLFSGKKSNNIATNMKTRMLLNILLNNAKTYLKSLKSIQKQADEIEKKLHYSIENTDFIEMMELGKSLLYFTTSLKSIQVILDKLMKSSPVKMYEEDTELLEDVIIENKQALEMSEIYSGILNGNMDAYGSIVSNNMNVVQKFLAVATIFLSIPNIITGAFGMNLKYMPLDDTPGAFWIINVLSVVLSLVALYYFQHKKMY